MSRQTSARYLKIDTEQLVNDALALIPNLDRGLTSVKYIGPKDTMGKHGIVVTFKDRPHLDPTGSQIYPQLLIMNAHNGTRALTVALGFFRLVCANGAMMATLPGAASTTRIIHLQSNAEQVKQLAYEIAGQLAAVPVLLDYLRTVSSVKVPDDVSLAIIEALPNLSKAARTEVVNRWTSSRRPEDQAPTLYSLWNTVNETIRVRGRSELAAVTKNRDLLAGILSAHRELVAA